MQIVARIIGALVMIAGILSGIYFGVIYMFMNGIVIFLDAVKATPVDSHGVAEGIARVVFAFIGGSGIASLGFLLGLWIFNIGAPKHISIRNRFPF